MRMRTEMRMRHAKDLSFNAVQMRPQCNHASAKTRWSKQILWDPKEKNCVWNSIWGTKCDGCKRWKGEIKVMLSMRDKSWLHGQPGGFLSTSAFTFVSENRPNWQNPQSDRSDLCKRAVETPISSVGNMLVTFPPPDLHAVPATLLCLKLLYIQCSIVLMTFCDQLSSKQKVYWNKQLCGGRSPTKYLKTWCIHKCTSINTANPLFLLNSEFKKEWRGIKLLGLESGDCVLVACWLISNWSACPGRLVPETFWWWSSLPTQDIVILVSCRRKKREQYIFWQRKTCICLLFAAFQVIFKDDCYCAHPSVMFRIQTIQKSALIKRTPI